MTAEIAAIVTARNEAERLPRTLAALRTALPEARLIVADDASSDGTGEAAERAGAELVRAPRRLGKGGAATLAAERLGGGSGARVVLLCDGDLAESAARLPALVEPVERGEADLVVAAFARRMGGGFGVALGFARFAVRRLTGLELEAPISGQRVLRTELLGAVLPFAHGFGMEIGMTVDAHRAGFRVAELELELEHRASGRSAGGFVHRGRQLADFARVYCSRAWRREGRARTGEGRA